MNYIFKIILFLILSLFLISSNFAQESNNSQLYKKGTSFEIIKKDNNIAIQWLKHSPKKKSRFSTIAHDRTGKKKDSYGHGICDLLIFNNDSLVFSTEGVFPGHCWNPGGTKLAYINGDFDGTDRMNGNSVWIYDVEKRESIPVVTGLEDLYLDELNWAEFDGNLYVKSLQIGKKVYRVDREYKKLVQTKYHATNFSPDGIYYLDAPLEGEEGRLYRRETNELIWNNYPEKPFLKQFVKWSKNKKGETLLYVTGHNEAGILNCETLEFKVFDSPNFLMDPVFDGENVKWEKNEEKEEFLKKQRAKGLIKE